MSMATTIFSTEKLLNPCNGTNFFNTKRNKEDTPTNTTKLPKVNMNKPIGFSLKFAA